ncbi:sigma-70 family RNA polymerase sigma factor [Prevotella sp.]|uniref:sigma-70 family RNA polymerase sigma factor n=1 Tax=Prevotella sp. TaxID=59823 RepID=UPI0030776238
MEVKKIYTEDLQIAKALIQRDNMVTRKYFYQHFFPLFKSIFDNYYTDCTDYKEFIDEIYIVVLTPSKITGKCQMENYRGESTLASWIKTACLFYCYKKYELKQRMPVHKPLPHNTEEEDGEDAISDRKSDESLSNPIDFSDMNRADVETLLSLMSNVRYRNIIRLLYLEQKSHKEIAEALGMSMDNYYNKRILAEKQFKQVCRKEARHA